MNQSRTQLFKWILVTMVLLLVVAGSVACGKSDEETLKPVNEEPQNVEPETPLEPDDDQVDEEQKEEEKEYPYTAPLTGVGSEEMLQGRVIMVMINNHPAARPQSGLDKADIVYEILSEGSITRMVAIYHSQEPEVVGPVRSIRPYYIDIGLGYDAIQVHAGGSPEALRILKEQQVAHTDAIYNAGAYFWRESFRKAPHNLYTDLDKIREAADRLGFRENGSIPQLLFVDEDAEAQGETAEKIDIAYTSTYQISYEYDEENGNYLRFTSGETHKDLTTDQQLTATNILVGTAAHRILDNEGRRHIDVYGPGDGYLFQKGKVQKVKWERKDGVIRAFKDGKEVGLYPGNTWVHIIPNVPPLEEKVTYQ